MALLVVSALVIVSPEGLVVFEGPASIVPKASEGMMLPGRGSPELYSPKRCYLVRYIRKGLYKLAYEILDFSRASER